VSQTNISLLVGHNGDLLVFEDASDWKTDGQEIEFTDKDGKRIVSNCRYILEETVPEDNG
jgi:hypothetical protein